jgi:hypothetical protein
MSVPAVTEPTTPETPATPTDTTTPVAPTSPAPSTNNAPPVTADMQRMAMAQLAEENRRLQNELAARNTVAQPAKVDAADFLADPFKHMQDAMRETVAPLMQFKESYERTNQYSALKTQIQSQAPHLYQQYIELQPLVDQFMDGKSADFNTFQAALVSAAGARALGLYGNTTPAPVAQAPTPTPTPTPNMIPPHIPPSPPAPPRAPTNNAVADKVAALTESERTIARAWNMTPEQFVAYRDASEEVSSWGGIK